MDGSIRFSTIGLCMIVKNETAVIERCLDSVRLLVDYVLVEDTGSTDGTQQLIRDWLAKNHMAGEVIEEPWRDFAYNRSHAMAKLRERQNIDYALIIDADDKLVTEDGFDPKTFKAGLDRDLYDIQIRHGGSRFTRPQLCANKLPFCFEAVLHEYLKAPPEPISRSDAKGFYIETGRGGARSKNPRKYQDDAAALEKALATEADPFLISRYTFYLARSYNDCGEREKALANYRKRAKLGYWAEEVFISLYEAAKLMDALGKPADEVIAACRRATEASPARAEALHYASRLCRARGRYEEGYQFAKRGSAIPLPPGGLFVETWTYDYGLLDELAVNGYWSGHYRESLDACLKMMACPALPDSQRARVLQNARFACDKLPGDRDLGSAGQEGLVEQHRLTAKRPLHSRLNETPRIFVAVLAKQKERMLPLFIECIEALDYPKSSIVLYVRTNNNTDRTEQILRDWIARVGPQYASVEFDAENVAEPVERFAAHEWNATRFKVLGHIRNESMRRALEEKCDFYFAPDVDNFIRPCTLRELVALNLPIVAPLLRDVAPSAFYSNYHAEVDANGYYKDCDQYRWILNRWIRGVIEVPVVHSTYLVRTDVIPQLSFEDATNRHEYVVFSDSARKAQIPQYIDNRQVYGYIAFDEGSDRFVRGGIELARSYLASEFTFRGAGKHSGSNQLKIIASMTTIPSRINMIRPVVESVLSQTTPIVQLEINIPYKCTRTGEIYDIPAWLKQIQGIKIFRTEDLGPITKIAPTLLRYQCDSETYIWSIDDDCAYPANQLEILLRAHRAEKRRILTRYGGKLNSDGTVNFWYGEADVTMLEGFGGVLYPPACIENDFVDYIKLTSANSECRKSDDLVLAMYFNSIGVPIHLYNIPSEGIPYMITGILPHSRKDALCQNGYTEIYKKIFQFISAFLQTPDWKASRLDGEQVSARGVAP
jgi:glycosyltransferase involved in cell wall biosynthesis